MTMLIAMIALHDCHDCLNLDDFSLQLLQHFADDLVAVRTKVALIKPFPNLTFDWQVTLLLSEQDVNLVGDNLDGKESAATKLLRVIIAIAF